MPKEQDSQPEEREAETSKDTIEWSRRRGVKVGTTLILVFIAVAVLGALPPSFVRSGQNALWFSSTLAQVSIALAGLILIAAFYFGAKEDSKRFSRVILLLFIAATFFVGSSLLALVDIASLDVAAESLSFYDRMTTLFGAGFFVDGFLVARWALKELEAR